MNNASIQLGRQAIISLYEKSLEYSQIDFICLSSKYSEVVGDWFDKVYAAKLYDGKRITREVLPKSDENQKFAATKPGTSEVRFTKDVRAETDIVLTSDWVALVSFDVTQSGVIVFTDKGIIQTFKNMFEAYWEKAEK